MIMQFHKSGYYHQHDKDFRIERPDGSGDYLLHAAPISRKAAVA